MFQKELLSSLSTEDSDERLQHMKTLQRELNMARNIQTSLLNGIVPYVEGGEVAGSSQPARLIGGDYFDFYPLLNGKLRIVIGDVMGKGIPAAMLMILTRGAFRSAAESTQSPGMTLTAMNQALFKDLRTLKSFVTLFCADWDPAESLLTYANAGHYHPLVLQGSDRSITELPEVKGIMIGGLPQQKYKEGCVHLCNEDTVFFYTDGIIEAQNQWGEQFMKERLIQTLFENQHKDVKGIEQGVMDALSEFTKGVPQKDDITMVILKINKQQVDITSFNAPIL